jgi:hypothetical protein
MKVIQSTLALAILSAITMPATAAEYKYRRYDKVEGFGDKSRIDMVSGYVFAGKFFQSFGSKLACDASAGKPCKHSLSGSSATETSWKVGAEVLAKTKFAWEGVDGKVVGEYAKKTTDTDTYTYTNYPNPGYTSEASTYVERDLVNNTYYGVWVKITEPVRCPGTILTNCAKYEWKSDEILGTVKGLVQRSGEQTFKFLTYKNGQRPAYKLEAD